MQQRRAPPPALPPSRAPRTSAALGAHRPSSQALVSGPRLCASAQAKGVAVYPPYSGSLPGAHARVARAHPLGRGGGEALGAGLLREARVRVRVRVRLWVRVRVRVGVGVRVRGSPRASYP